MKRLLFSLLLVLSNAKGSCDNKDVRPFVKLPDIQMEHPNNSVYTERIGKSNKYTMVVYVDKTDCPTCFISHLYEWEIFMKECKENEIPIEFLFINSSYSSSSSIGHGTDPSVTCAAWVKTIHLGTIGKTSVDCQSGGNEKCISGKCPHEN